MTNPEAMPSKETVADLFTMRAFEIESIEEKNGDTLYDLKVLPDRSPYAYGIRYVALELSLFVPELNFNPSFLSFAKTNIEVDSDAYAVSSKRVHNAAQEFCPVYTLTLIENIHNNASPTNHIEALQSLNQQSRGTIVDLTNLVMYDTGQPLHAFDADKVDGEIRVEVLDVDTEVKILGGKKVALKKGMLVIADDKDVLAIAGVKGCVKAEVTAETKNIYLESALFNRVTVRKTSRALDIINDSSKRFEQGVTRERSILAVERFKQKVLELIPEANIHTTETSVDVQSIISQKHAAIEVDIEQCVKLIDAHDTSIQAKLIAYIENTLPKTGADVVKKSEGKYVITAPMYRTDLQIEADVVDEFIRNIGYEVIVYKRTDLASNVEQEKRYTVLHMVRKFITEKGYTEVLLHTLVDSKKNEKAVLLDNALTSERDALRAELAPELLQAIVKNYPHLDTVEKKAVELFEIGMVNYVEQKEGKKQVKQKLHLALGVGMPKWPKKTDETSTPANILKELAIYLQIDANAFAEVAVFENKDKNAFVSEADITNLIDDVVLPKHTGEQKEYLSPNARIKTFPYKKASIYPSMSRDIAFFVTGESKEHVDAEIRTVAKKYALIETVTLFDVFTKEDKTSYGYRFVFQSYEKTLTEEEVKTIMDEIGKFVDNKGWVIR